MSSRVEGFGDCGEIDMRQRCPAVGTIWILAVTCDGFLADDPPGLVRHDIAFAVASRAQGYLSETVPVHAADLSLKSEGRSTGSGECCATNAPAKVRLPKRADCAFPPLDQIAPHRNMLCCSCLTHLAKSLSFVLPSINGEFIQSSQSSITGA